MACGMLLIVASSRTLHEFEQGVLETLHAHPRDAPFAMMYFAEELGSATPTDSEPRVVRLRYAGGVGVPTDHPSAPEVITVPLRTTSDARRTSVSAPSPLPMLTESHLSHLLDSPAQSSASTFESNIGSLDPGWQYADVLSTSECVVIDCEVLVQDFPVRAWEDHPTQAIVVPLSLKSDDGIPGAVLVLGISPRLEFDPQYRDFVEE